MKGLCVFFALLTLPLSTTPCCGAEEGACQEKTTASCSGHHDEGETSDSGHPELPCSPFLSCGTCIGCISNPLAFFDFQSYLFTEKTYGEYYRFSVPKTSSFPLIKPPTFLAFPLG